MSGVVLPEVLRRGPLTLRLWCAEDASQLEACIAENLEWLRPWMPWVGTEPLSRARRLEMIDDWRRRHSEGSDATYGIFLHGEPVGGTGLHQRIGEGGLEIGYWVARSVTRRRIALTTAAMLTVAGLDAAGIDRVEIHHAVENVRSEAIPRTLGYRRSGTIVGEPLGPGLSGVQQLWRMSRMSLTPARRIVLDDVHVRIKH